MKVGDLVGFKEDKYKEIGIVTSVTGCHYGYIEIVIGKWKGQIRSIRLKVINEGRYSCNSINSPSIPIPNTVRKL